MSKDYIECRNCDSPYCNGCNVNTLSKMLHKGAFKRITDEHHSIIPVAEVVAVKHGRWDGSGIIFPVFKCSVCGCATPLGMTNYCPNCGAKMDGGADNG